MLALGMAKREGMSAVEIGPYEGLIGKSAYMWADQCGMEIEDLRQELALKVAEALTKFNPSRSKLSVKNYVFGCMTNRITDLRKSHCRRLNYGIRLCHIEAFDERRRHALGADHAKRDRFEYEWLHVDHDEIFGKIDEGLFVLPSSLTPVERKVLLLLTLEMSRAEIALRLGISRADVSAATEALQEKFRDWQPGSQTNECSIVELGDVNLPAVAAA